MKSNYRGKTPGNAKLKGKIYKLLRCGCCQLFNWKWRERVREAKKEIWRAQEGRNG